MIFSDSGAFASGAPDCVMTTKIPYTIFMDGIWMVFLLIQGPSRDLPRGLVCRRVQGVAAARRLSVSGGMIVDRIVPLHSLVGNIAFDLVDDQDVVVHCTCP